MCSDLILTKQNLRLHPDDKDDVPRLPNPRVSSNPQLLQSSPVSQVGTLSHSELVPDRVVWRADPLLLSDTDGAGQLSAHQAKKQTYRVATPC